MVTASIATGSSEIGNVIFVGGHTFSTANVNAGNPTVASPAMVNIHNLSTPNLNTGTPSVPNGVAQVAYSITTSTLSSGAPVVPTITYDMGLPRVVQVGENSANVSILSKSNNFAIILTGNEAA